MLAADAAAHRAGVRVGTPATKARVIVPDLIVHDHDAAGDADALDRLALWVLQRYAPIVAADSGDGLVIDSTGVEHLHGGEEVMLAGLVDRLAASGVRARAAIADTWGAAHALARFDVRPVPGGPDRPRRIRPRRLPLAALRLPTETVSALQILGFERIGNLLAQPRAPLTLRFGPQLGRRIDQALGMLSEPIEPVRPDELIEVKRNFAEPLPLFAAAAAREDETVPEVNEPAVALRPMTAGSEVVEDYGHVGLTLRDHPLSFLREDLRRRRIVTCAEAMATRDGRWLEAAGIVLVRQRPGSAKGVMFITLEDETGIVNLVVWAKVFEANRRAVLSASMMAVRGRIQREGDVVHLVAQRIMDLSADLASVGSRDAAFPLPHGRGDRIRNGRSAPDPRELPPKGLRTRDIYIPDLHIDTIKVKSRDFH